MKLVRTKQFCDEKYKPYDLTKQSVKPSNIPTIKPLSNTSNESSAKPSNASSVKSYSNTLNTRLLINRPSIESSTAKPSNASNTRSSIKSSAKSSKIPSIRPLSNSSNTSSTIKRVQNLPVNHFANSSTSKIPVRMSPSAIASKIVPPLKTSDSFESLAECETDNNNHEDFSFSQEEFKKLCTQFALSQTTDCIEILKDSKMLEIKENSETCSKYVFTTKKAEFYNDRPTSNLIVSQGNFFGLSDKMKNFILELKKIQKLYDWQEECLKLDAIAERRNLIYVLPTSGGKTLVSEILMLREVMLRKKNAIFIVPYISIVQE